MYESLIFAVILIFLNLIFGIKPHPIFSVFISSFTFFICVTYFVTDSTLPLNSPNPIFTIFIALLSGASLLMNYLDYKKLK